MDIRLGLLMIGDVAVASVDGNPYAAIGLRLKKESLLRKNHDDDEGERIFGWWVYAGRRVLRTSNVRSTQYEPEARAR